MKKFYNLGAKHGLNNLLRILTCDPLICTKNHSRFNVSNQMEELISIKRVKLIKNFVKSVTSCFLMH